MAHRWPIRCAAMALALIGSAYAETTVPDDFPRFIVPGYDGEMDALRRLMWLHYPGGGPKATLWDEWLATPSLWPAVNTNGHADAMRRDWRAALSGRIIDSEGYVATHQHTSIAHQLGWPFPFWAQGHGGWGWHFNLDGISRAWHGTEVKTQEGWTIENAADHGIRDGAWNLTLEGPFASAAPPALRIDPYNAPFLQLRWRASGLGDAQSYVEWTTEESPEYSPERRFRFEAIESDDFVHTMIPVYRHPGWRGPIIGLRIQFGNRLPGGTVGIQSIFTQYDTRHNINNQNFVRGCAQYFNWTGDVPFLREQINRMRIALRYIMTEFHADTENLVLTRWVGHEGTSGIERKPDGTKVIHSGRGIGNNYWDLLPMGYKDCYATYQYYDALRVMASIERAIMRHPDWGVERGALAFTPEALERRAARVKEKGNDVFWNEETGRFFCSRDINGAGYDYGFTFLNLEAIYYGFAAEEHAKSIMDWICGDRIVEGDTSTGADIYHWRFGPRATTKRNIDYYLWAWSSPESIPFGNQVQDGGAVMGFSYYDLMSRLVVRGPDSVTPRIREIADWFDEVTAAGGYRKYYDGSRDGTLQGGGTPGGLGLDHEFFESLLLPQVLIRGFLGFEAHPDGFSLNPRLPSDWPELTATRIRFRDLVLDVSATHDSVEVRVLESNGHEGTTYTVTMAADGWTPRIAELSSGAAPATTLRFTKT